MSEVLAFLADRKEFEYELCEVASMVDLDGESEDKNEQWGTVLGLTAPQMLLDAEVLASDSGALISLMLNSPSPAKRDGLNTGARPRLEFIRGDVHHKQ